jgi:hypothetical protein
VSHDISNLPAPIVLDRIDAELRRCRSLLERIEEEVLPLVSHPIAPTLRAALQDIDLLSQCLDDISRSVLGVSHALDPQTKLNISAIMASIRLQDMRIRLEGGQYDSRKLIQKEEMFDTAMPTTSAASFLF